MIESYEQMPPFKKRIRIILPKHWISTEALSSATIIRPLFFLGGPIRGGGDWQAQACTLLSQHPKLAEVVVACPCRWSPEHSLHGSFLKGPENFFERQLDWERHYLELAGVGRNPGCIIFYLPFEDQQQPHPGPEPYGMDTRGELGEWRMRMKYEGARVVVGADPRFHGLSQIKRNFSQVLGYDFPIYPSIAQTVNAAAKMVLGF